MPTKIRVDTRAIFRLGERFDLVSASLPSFRRVVMTKIGMFARANLVSTYELDLPLNPMLGYQLPSVYRGAFGRSVRLFITPQGTITIRAEGGDTNIDVGVEPRRLSSTEREAIADWAESKLGVTSPRVINSIIRRIETRGIIARRIFDDAFRPDTPRGMNLDRFIERTLDEELNRLFDEAGFTR